MLLGFFFFCCIFKWFFFSILFRIFPYRHNTALMVGEPLNFDDRNVLFESKRPFTAQENKSEAEPVKYRQPQAAQVFISSNSVCDLALPGQRYVCL